MKRIIFGLIVAAVAAAILVPLAVAGGGNSANAQACQKGGWQGLARQGNTGFNNQDECVSYAAHGGVLTKKQPAPEPTPVEPIAVSEPTFGLDVNTCSVRIPVTPGIDTVLYGVSGYPETPITKNVTVTGGLAGAPDTAGQFWIGYTAQPGYEISNPGASPTHFDFYNGDYVRDC